MSAADRLRLQLAVMVEETDAARLLDLVRLLDDARAQALAKYNATPQWVDCGRCSTCALPWEVHITPARERSHGIPGECPACWNRRNPATCTICGRCSRPPSVIAPGQWRYM